VFLQQRHVGDGHAAVHGFAHVVDGEQGDLHGGQGFHLHARGARALGRGVAQDAVRGRLHLKRHRHAGQSNRVTQRDQVAGFFGRLNARDARDTEHIALFGRAQFDQPQGLGQHPNAALCRGAAAGRGFVGHVHHVGLAMGIEMGQRLAVGHEKSAMGGEHRSNQGIIWQCKL
jgi:hypothetical protein